MKNIKIIFLTLILAACGVPAVEEAQNPFTYEYQRQPTQYFDQWSVIQYDGGVGAYMELDDDEGVIFLHENEGNDATALHEVGHYFDHISGDVSQSEEFRKDMAAYLNRDDPVYPALQEYITDNLLLPEEVFAQLYVLTLVAPDKVPNEFRGYFSSTLYARSNPEWRR